MNELTKHLSENAVAFVILGGVISGATQILKRMFRANGSQVKAVPVFLSFALAIGIAIQGLPVHPSSQEQGRALLEGILSGVMISLSALGIHNVVRKPDTPAEEEGDK